MKRTWIAVVGVVLLAAAPLYAEESNILQTSTDKESYSAGVEIVRNLMRQGGALNLDAVIQGMKDGLTGQCLLMTEEELRMALAARQAEVAGAQKHEAIRLGRAQSMSVAEAPASAPAAAQPQAAPAVPVPAVEAGPLASRGSSAGSAGAVAAVQSIDPVVAQRESAQMMLAAQAKQEQRTAPDGSVLSRRNQALMQVQQLKAQRVR